MRDLGSARRRYGAMTEASGYVNGESVAFDDMLKPFVLHANVDGERLDRMIEGACQRAAGRIEGGTDLITVMRGMVASAMAVGFFIGTEPDE